MSATEIKLLQLDCGKVQPMRSAKAKSAKACRIRLKELYKERLRTCDDDNEAAKKDALRRYMNNLKTF